MAIQLTESAARHVRQQLEQRGHGKGLRIGTRKSGCTGFAYSIDFADDILPTDHCYEQHGVRVIVDQQSLPLLDGTVIDFVKSNLLNQGLEFRNPNVSEQCGCGESFNVKA